MFCAYISILFTKTNETINKRYHSGSYDSVSCASFVGTLNSITITRYVVPLKTACYWSEFGMHTALVWWKSCVHERSIQMRQWFGAINHSHEGPRIHSAANNKFIVYLILTSSICIANGKFILFGQQDTNLRAIWMSEISTLFDEFISNHSE